MFFIFHHYRFTILQQFAIFWIIISSFLIPQILITPMRHLWRVCFIFYFIGLSVEVEVFYGLGNYVFMPAGVL